MRVLGIFSIASIALCSAATAQDAAVRLNPGEVLLQVEAEGHSKNRPDVMGITAGVITNGDTAAEALAANSERADRMIKAVRDLGIAPEDARTSELSVRPVMSKDEDQNRSTRPPTILGYVATNQIELQLRDLGRAPSIIDALFKNGANSVRGPVFSLSDPKPAQRQARFDAVKNAREEAETYAAAFGLRVARVVRSSERGDFRYEGNEIIVSGTRIPRTPIEPGELTTTINLRVDYALAPKT
jgi:uncharacterized protein YggE